MDGRPNLRLFNVILDVQITPFGPKSLYGSLCTLSLLQNALEEWPWHTNRQWSCTQFKSRHLAPYNNKMVAWLVRLSTEIQNWTVSLSIGLIPIMCSFNLDDSNRKFMTSYASILAFAYQSLADSAPSTRSCRQINPSSILAKARSRYEHC